MQTVKEESNENIHLLIVAYEKMDDRIVTKRIVEKFHKDAASFPITLVQVRKSAVYENSGSY